MFLVVVSGYFTGDIWGYNQMFCVVYIYIYIYIITNMIMMSNMGNVMWVM